MNLNKGVYRTKGNNPDVFGYKWERFDSVRAMNTKVASRKKGWITVGVLAALAGGTVGVLFVAGVLPPR